MAGYQLQPIGVISSPFREKEEAPRQGRLAPVTSEIRVFPEFAEGLKDLALHPRLIVLYWCDRCNVPLIGRTCACGAEGREIELLQPYDVRPALAA
jgi:tRNA (Thr-GGU) A37 N-methylase